MADSYASQAEVASLVANVDKAAKSFEEATVGDVHAARRSLHLEVQRLLSALEEPNQEVWARIFQVIFHVAYTGQLLTICKDQC